MSVPKPQTTVYCVLKVHAYPIEDDYPRLSFKIINICSTLEIAIEEAHANNFRKEGLSPDKWLALVNPTSSGIENIYFGTQWNYEEDFFLTYLYDKDNQDIYWEKYRNKHFPILIEEYIVDDGYEV